MGLDFQEEIHNQSGKSLPKKRTRCNKFIYLSYFQRFGVRFTQNYHDFCQDLSRFLLTHSEFVNFYFGLISVPAHRLPEQLMDL